MIQAGAAIIDVTPPPGLAMSGFAARSLTATGAHDALTARALVIGNTAIVVADVIGIDKQMSMRIRQRCSLPTDNVVVAALHTHGGPVSMKGRLGIPADPTYLERLEDACVAAINKAAASRQPAEMTIARGSDPRVARNRRHIDGPVDATLPLLRVRGEDGAMIAVVTGYACHPVVLAADNLLWTADYPHFVRQALEDAHPGAIAIFLTGCVGDVNTGHSAHASITLTAAPDRTFDAARRIGSEVAQSALTALERPATDSIHVFNDTVMLQVERREADTPEALQKLWRDEARTAEPARRNLLGYWTEWAQHVAPKGQEPLVARVTLFDWGGVTIVALPGEIFTETALSIRAGIAFGEQSFIIGFAEDNPGYIPPASEFQHGGYEVDEAHRYYGMPMTFAPGSAEALARCAIGLARKLNSAD